MPSHRLPLLPLLALVLAGLALLLLPSPSPAQPPNTTYYCAIAFSKTTGKYGYCYGWLSEVNAERVAVKNCKAADARVIVRVDNGYAALPGPGRRLDGLRLRLLRERRRGQTSRPEGVREADEELLHRRLRPLLGRLIRRWSHSIRSPTSWRSRPRTRERAMRTATGVIPSSAPTTSVGSPSTVVRQNACSVRFFRDGKADYLTVDRELPVDTHGQYQWFAFAYPGETVVVGPHDPIWAALAEKAYAQASAEGWFGQVIWAAPGSYAAIEFGGDSGQVVQRLTGQGLDYLGYGATDEAILAQQYQKGDYLMLSSVHFQPNGTPIIPKDLINADGVVNPWGIGNGEAPATLWLSWDQINNDFGLKEAVSRASAVPPADSLTALADAALTDFLAHHNGPR